MKTIHYADDGHGFPIVWIHGFPLSAEMFEPQLAIAGYRHIRPDLRGFGKTPAASGEVSMATYAQDVLAVLDDAGVDRAVIAGFSMGGYIAMELLRRAPERASALLLLDTRETADTDEARAVRRHQIAEVEHGGTGALVASMLPKMAEGEAVRVRIRAIMESATQRGVIGALEAMASRPDSSATLRNCPVATLVVVGDRDPITPPVDAERMMLLLPHAELAPIAQAAHMANFERPAQLNPLLAAFLMRHVARPGHD